MADQVVAEAPSAEPTSNPPLPEPVPEALLPEAETSPISQAEPERSSDRTICDEDDLLANAGGEDDTLDAEPVETPAASVEANASEDSDSTIDGIPVEASSPSLVDTPAPRKARMGILVLPGEPSRILRKSGESQILSRPASGPPSQVLRRDPVEPLPWNPTGSVVARVEGPKENRFLRRLAPSWVISGIIHSLLAVGLILIVEFSSQPVPPSNDTELVLIVEEPQKKEDLSNPDLGFDPQLEAAVLVDTPLDTTPAPMPPDPTTDPGSVAVADAPPKFDTPPPAGLGGDPSSVENTFGDVLAGAGREGPFRFSTIATAEYQGRSAAGRMKLVQEGGGNDKSEAAVARGLAWVAKQQKKDGSWEFTLEDDIRGGRRILRAGKGQSMYQTAATGMSLLPFLAAGYTHRSGPDQKYQTTVAKGLEFLVKNQEADGSFTNNKYKCMYSHAIATVALCEAYGMTADRSTLQTATKKAVKFIIESQGEDGSWGYTPKQTGDTSIVGWQIQALHSARLSHIDVPDEVFARARKFLDRVSTDSIKSTYGYRAPGATPTMTSVGLLCRVYMDNWTAVHPGFEEGMKYLTKQSKEDNPLLGKMRGGFDMYFLYYAMQVAHFHGGETWFKDWNPRVRDMLINKQVVGAGDNSGSWDPDTGTIGGMCGRLGTTCLCLLTLEVYYRHLPLYKKDAPRP